MIFDMNNLQDAFIDWDSRSAEAAIRKIHRFNENRALGYRWPWDVSDATLKYTLDFDCIPCDVCRNRTLPKQTINGMCLYCILAINPFVLELSFGESKSKHYRKVCRMAEGFPSCEAFGKSRIIRFDSLDMYCMCRKDITELAFAVSGWKSASAALNGNYFAVARLVNLGYEINTMCFHLGASDVLFIGGKPFFVPKTS